MLSGAIHLIGSFPGDRKKKQNTLIISPGAQIITHSVLKFSGYALNVAEKK